MDPVEKAQLFVHLLPSRPQLILGRNGQGDRYWSLQYRNQDRYGDRDTKERMYLGALTPLQQLAVRQIIEDAWPDRRPNRSKRIHALKQDYKVIRKILAVLARRAGYSMHGCGIRKSKQMDTDENATDLVDLQLAMVPAETVAGIIQLSLTDPVDAFRRGLLMIQGLDLMRISEYQKALAKYRRKGELVTDAEKRTVNAMHRAQESYRKHGEALLRLLKDTTKAVIHDT